MESFSRVNWVAWPACFCVASWVRSIMAPQTFCAKAWYAVAALANSLRIQSPVIVSLARSRSYTYLVPSDRL